MHTAAWKDRHTLIFLSVQTPQDTSVSLSMKFKALVFLSHLLSSASEADTAKVQSLLQNSEVCSITASILKGCVAKGTANYEGDEWSQKSIAQLLLLLSKQPENAVKMVTSLNVTELLVHLLAFLRPTQAEVALLAFDILLNVSSVKMLQKHIEEAGVVMAVEVGEAGDTQISAKS